MLLKTSELIDIGLDWAVAQSEGIGDFRQPEVGPSEPDYSSNWSFAGPIIERERLLLEPEVGKEGAGNAWSAITMGGTFQYGPTAIVAAMRCYVASTQGVEVEIPDDIAEVMIARQRAAASCAPRDAPGR